MRRFFCESIPAIGAVTELAPDEAKHLRTVLRDAGGKLELLDGCGKRATAELVHDGNRRRARVRILACEELPRATRQLHVYVAPPRPKQMNLIVRQVTELGVSTIQPIITARSTPLAAKSSPSSWLTQAREGLKQSGNPWLPRICPAVDFATALASAPPGWVGAPAHLGSSGASDPINAAEQAIWVGPEGGFTDDEMNALAQRATVITLGEWILRVETAVVGVVAAVHDRWRRSAA